VNDAAGYFRAVHCAAAAQPLERRAAGRRRNGQQM